MHVYVISVYVFYINLLDFWKSHYGSSTTIPPEMVEVVASGEDNEQDSEM